MEEASKLYARRLVGPGDTKLHSKNAAAMTASSTTRGCAERARQGLCGQGSLLCSQQTRRVAPLPQGQFRSAQLRLCLDVNLSLGRHRRKIPACWIGCWPQSSRSRHLQATAATHPSCVFSFLWRAMCQLGILWRRVQQDACLCGARHRSPATVTCR